VAHLPLRRGAPLLLPEATAEGEGEPLAIGLVPGGRVFGLEVAPFPIHASASHWACKDRRRMGHGRWRQWAVAAAGAGAGGGRTRQRNRRRWWRAFAASGARGCRRSRHRKGDEGVRDGGAPRGGGRWRRSTSWAAAAPLAVVGVVAVRVSILTAALLYGPGGGGVGGAPGPNWQPRPRLRPALPLAAAAASWAGWFWSGPGDVLCLFLFYFEFVNSSSISS